MNSLVLTANAALSARPVVAPTCCLRPAVVAAQRVSGPAFTPVKQARAAERPCVRVNAAAAASSDGSSDSGMGKTLLLGVLFGGWYAFNIVFNIYNKQVLNAFFFPLTCTTYQFLLGGLIGLGWFVASGKKIDTSPQILKAVFPLAVVHTLGNLLTNCSLGMVAVSFTHTIKAMEPFFSVLLSALFLGDKPNPLVLLSLVPIVGGVALASVSEASFNWTGFATAMGSNVTFQSRNVLSKKVMTPDVKEQLGGSIGLFSMITILSFFILAPIALLVEGVKFTPSAMQALGIADPKSIFMAATYAALTFHAYQQVSYMILARVTPVTHSIGNCIKRIIVIAASVLFFRNPVSTTNAVGTATALLGVFAYSQIKRMTSKKGKAGGSSE